jgi:HK97 family phage portal protein
MMWADIRNIFASPESKSSRTVRLISLEGGGRARWTPRDYTALAREGYARNAIVYRAVRLIAESVGSLCFVLYEGAAERDAHPLLDLLRRPNPRQDGASFLESVASHLLLAGNAISRPSALKAAGGVQVRELYTLRPDCMKSCRCATGWPQAYEYKVAGSDGAFRLKARPCRRFCISPFFNPLDDHYGFSPL